MKYVILTPKTCFDCETQEEIDELVKEQDKELKALGYDFDKEYPIVFHYGNKKPTDVEIMSIEEAIQCLSIKEGVDLVQFPNCHIGYMAYYSGYENGFEVI